MPWAGAGWQLSPLKPVSLQPAGLGVPGGMTLEELEQSRTGPLSVPCGHSDTGGGGFC